MRSRRLVAVITTAALTLLGGAAIAHEHNGPAPTAALDTTDEPDGDTLTLEPETATDRSAGARAFSEWVRSTDLTGCQRGQTVAKYAQEGPTTFQEGQTVEPVPEDELPGNCAGSLDAEDDPEADATSSDEPEDLETEDTGPVDEADGLDTEEAESDADQEDTGSDEEAQEPEDLEGDGDDDRADPAAEQRQDDRRKGDDDADVDTEDDDDPGNPGGAPDRSGDDAGDDEDGDD